MLTLETGYFVCIGVLRNLFLKRCQQAKLVRLEEKEGIIMELRTAASPKDVKHYTTERLREEFFD